jgi:putative Ig domain-containing protein
MMKRQSGLRAGAVLVLTLLSVACGGGNPPAGSDIVTGTQMPTPTAYYLGYLGPLLFPVGVASVSDPPTNDNTSGNRYSISPQLPLGLTIDADSGVISGTPTAVTPPTSYTVTDDNSGAGEANATVVLEVDEGPFFYSSPAVVEVGSSMTPLRPRNPPAASSYSVAPALPAGLSIDPATGVISGTPTSPQPAAYYEISANRSLLTLKFGLTLEVDNPAATDTAGAAPNSTLDCEHSGGFIGTYEDVSQPEDQGLVAIAFEPDGTVRAKVLDLYRNITQRSDGLSMLSTNSDGSLDIALTGSAGTLHGNFAGSNIFSGTYSSGGVSRPFRTARLGGALSAQVRYTGGFGAAHTYTSVGFGVLDRTGNDGQGVGYEFTDFRNYNPQSWLLNRQFAIQGTFAGDQFTWSESAIGQSGIATLPSVGLGLELGYVYDDDVIIEMTGCHLN